MKKVMLFLLAASLFTACQDTGKKETTAQEKTDSLSAPQYFGEKITEEGAMPSDSLKAMMGDSTKLNCKLVGKINAVCQKKGCWMELMNADSSTIRVTFKDYGFFMPKDASGRTAIVDGFASVDVTSIEDLKEFAKDNGDSKEAIAAIKEPKKELVFEAKGVILK